MSSREAACELCRKAKLACDHKRPVCTRCEKSNRASNCVYRGTPFKRKRLRTPTLSVVQLSHPVPPDPLSAVQPRHDFYPNPGYLGSSSHVAIFNQISPGGDGTGANAASEAIWQTAPNPQLLDDNLLARQGADVLKQLLNRFDLNAMTESAIFWLAKDVNLALAGPFVHGCVESMKHLMSSRSQEENWHLSYARLLLQNSARPLDFNNTSNISSFSAQFMNENIRWETLGLFLSAVIRATFEGPFFPSLYKNERERYDLRQLATNASDCFLEIALSLDCLNDLQLFLQYENFIVHSHVDGDQSYHSWRKLGDVIASITALGYHEKLDSKTDTPPFLVELRKTAFARIYSADKNVAIFLGRPPRMSKRFCYFQIPSKSKNSHDQWHLDMEMDYRAETCWSALCASLKEEILDIMYEERHNDHTQRASLLQTQAEAQWQALPALFQFTGGLNKCNRSSFERDFLLSTRLNHLHVLFLLRLLLLTHLAEPDQAIVEIAQQMLKLVVEAILVREHLANSGTSLVWKVVHYGLPAAGVILLAMLKQPKVPDIVRVSRASVLQDLSVLVAELQIGTILRPGEPMYGLVSKATQTIRSFLDATNSVEQPEPLETPNAGHAQTHGLDDLFPFRGLEPWDFEIGFWESLAEHPSLAATDLDLQYLS